MTVTSDSTSTIITGIIAITAAVAAAIVRVDLERGVERAPSAGLDARSAPSRLGVREDRVDGQRGGRGGALAAAGHALGVERERAVE